MVKILFLAANPESTRRLNLEKEAREIQEALDISELAKEFELIQKWEVRPKDFRRALLKHKPDIVHFSGHGEGSSGLVIVDESSGASKAVTGEALAGLFARIPSVKCVLLNACYAELQAEAIVSHVDYVIGMRETIYDKAAIAFAIGFYDGLGYGRSIEEAFDLGSNAILWEYKSNSGENRAMIPVESVQVESSEKLPEHLKPVLLKKEKTVTEGISNQTQRNEPVVIRTNPREKYCARIQKYLAEGNFTPIAKWQLATFAKEQGISASEASSILEAELAKIEQAKETYEKLLRETMAKGFNPLAPKTQQELKGLQQALKLWDKEVAAINEAILAQTGGVETSKTEIQRIKKPIIEQKEAEARKRKEDESPPLQVFKFEVVTVNTKKKWWGLGTEITLNRSHSQAQYFTEDLGDGVTLDMVYIPGGKFRMGSAEGEGYESEKPQHEVTVQPFFIGKYPVTQAQWKAMVSLSKVSRDLNSDPSRFKGNDLPVETISWGDTIEFCQRLSKHTGRKYRLPSEAEWEYACRAGTTTPFHFGETITGELANYNADSTYANEPKGEYRGATTPVNSFPPNAFGLYDIHGNVWEWCEDDWHENYQGVPTDGGAWLSETSSSRKLIRSGSCYSNPDYCRSAYRIDVDRDDCLINLGFRVVCVALRTT